jgi:large subunit ribosomal protein L7/L12
MAEETNVTPEAAVEATPAAEEVKKPAVAEAKADKEVPAKAVEVPAKFKKIVEEIETMSVLELNELVKTFEDRFGVSATAVAVAGPAAGAGEAVEEKSTANVELTDGGANKIAVIKVVKEVLALGLKEAKDLVDAAPSMLKADMKKEEAEELKKKLEEAGAKVTLK